MKKIFTLIMLFFASSTAFGQISEDFSGVPLTPTTVGTATINLGGLATSWSQDNVDGLTPNTNLSYMGTNAWVAREITVNNQLDTVMQSISWYTPAGVSNDWLITPQFTVPTGASGDEVVLLWEGYTTDANFPDGYQVKLSTTGTATTDFTVTLATIAAENATGFLEHGVDLTQYSGQQVHIAFINNSNDKYVLFLDDIRTEVFTSFDAELSAFEINRFEKVNTNVTITGTIQNNGKTITSLNIDWTDGGTPNTATLTGLNITPASTYNFTHTVPFNQAAADEFNVSVNITQVNGGVTETNTNNNSQTGLISTVNNAPDRNVLFEEGTGTWCGWCPRGEVAMKAMYTNITDGSFIGVAVHNGDPMVDAAYNAGAAISGFPGSNIDRVMLGTSVSLTGWQAAYNERRAAVSPASVSHTASYDANTRILTVEATGNFNTKISTGVKLAAIVVEDYVSDASYNQANYYAGGGSGAMGGYESLPDPVPGSQMVYNHVGRALLGGYTGQAGSVAGIVTDGSSANHTFTYTLPTTVDPLHIKVVSVLIDASGQILNANEDHVFNPTNTNDFTTVNHKLVVYPTILESNELNLQFETKNENVNIEIYTLSGRKVLSKDLGKLNGKQNIKLALPAMAAGEYFLNFSTPGQTEVKRIISTK